MATAQVNSVDNIGGVSVGTVQYPAIVLPDGAQAVAGQQPVIKTLTAGCISVTTNYFYAFYDSTSASNTIYSVPNGKKFYISQVIYSSNTALAASTAFQLGTATASFTSNSATTSPTGAVFWFGGTTLVGSLGGGLPTYSTTSPNTFNIPLTINQNLFPFVQSGGGGGFVMMLIGKEA